MTNKETRHAALRERAVQIAFEILRAEGDAAVQARRISTEANCSVGTLYNVFGSLDGLWSAVNALTLQALQTEVDAVLEHANTTDNHQRALLACRAVIRFAHENAAQWRGLANGDVPASVPQGSVLELNEVSSKLHALIVAAHDQAANDDTVSLGADGTIALVEGLAARVAAVRGKTLCPEKAATVLACTFGDRALKG